MKEFIWKGNWSIKLSSTWGTNKIKIRGRTGFGLYLHKKLPQKNCKQDTPARIQIPTFLIDRRKILYGSRYYILHKDV